MGLFDNHVKVSMIQMKISSGKKQENLERALKHIKESSEAGAKLAVLPESFSTGINLTSIKKDAESLDESEVVQKLKEASIQYQLYICAGILEKKDGKIYDSLILISPDGELIYSYRRRILWKMEKDFCEAGTEAPRCIETSIGKIGFILGYEIYFPEACRELFRQEVDIIICPANILKMASSSIEVLCRARAEENHCYFLFVSCLGYHLFTNSNYMGNSMVTCNSSCLIYEMRAKRMDSTGLLIKAGEEEQVITVSLSIKHVAKHRKKNSELDDLRTYEERGECNKETV